MAAINEYDNESSEPPQTSEDEEEVDISTNNRKKERQIKRQQMKVKQKRIQNEKKQLKIRYSPPFHSIWNQLRCIQFDGVNGTFVVNGKILSTEILAPYVSVSHIRDFMYNVKYQFRTSFNTAIGYSTKKRLTHGTASQVTPRYSYVLDEEVNILQQDICVDMISMLHNYDDLEDKENDKIEIYRWVGKDQVIGGPKRLSYYYERMQDNTTLNTP
eukprot:UN07197